MLHFCTNSQTNIGTTTTRQCKSLAKNEPAFANARAGAITALEPEPGLALERDRQLLTARRTTNRPQRGRECDRQSRLWERVRELVSSIAAYGIRTSAKNGAYSQKPKAKAEWEGTAEAKKGCSCAAYPLQRFLFSTLGCVPTTAGSAQFCLLCCQPEPVPESLPARPPSLTRRCPCSLPVWLGQPIHMVHRTYSSPQHSASHTPTWGTERCDTPQIQI